MSRKTLMEQTGNSTFNLQDAENVTLDIKETLSRKVVDTTANTIIFREKQGKDEVPSYWTDFINNVADHNELDKLIKTDIKQKSYYGRTYVGFDLYKGDIRFGIGDRADSNQMLRINGITEYACVVNRTYSTVGSTPILRNQLIITNNSTQYLFLGGFGIKQKKQANPEKFKDFDEKRIKKMTKENFKKIKQELIEDTSGIPVQGANVKIPTYVCDQFKIGRYPHKYGVLPVTEMLNKDGIDNDIGGVEHDSNPYSDLFFSDWGPARDLLDLYNGLIQYFGSELLLDHTRIMGAMAQQDMNAIAMDQDDTVTKLARIKNLLNNGTANTVSAQEDDYLKKKLIIRTRGGENDRLEKMQSTLNGLQHVQTLEDLLVFIFKTCGYSGDTQSGQVYENISQTQNSSKGVAETTKQKITLFTKQGKKLFVRCAYAYFKYNKIDTINSIHQVEMELEKYVDFQIISNVLQQENNDGKKVIELKSSGLISLEKAIKDINPELDELEVKEEIDLIQSQNKMDNFNEQFLNENPFGSEEDENNEDKKSDKGKVNNE